MSGKHLSQFPDCSCRGSIVYHVCFYPLGMSTDPLLLKTSYPRMGQHSQCAIVIMHVGVTPMDALGFGQVPSASFGSCYIPSPFVPAPGPCLATKHNSGRVASCDIYPWMTIMKIRHNFSATCMGEEQ